MGPHQSIQENVAPKWGSISFVGEIVFPFLHFLCYRIEFCLKKKIKDMEMEARPCWLVNEG